MTSWLSQFSFIAETKFWHIMSSSTPQQQSQPQASSGGQQQQPPPEQIAQAVEAAKAAAAFQDAADALKKQARLATDPVEREKLWRAAYIKEKEAHGESKKARCKSCFSFYYCFQTMQFHATSTYKKITRLTNVALSHGKWMGPRRGPSSRHF